MSEDEAARRRVAAAAERERVEAAELAAISGLPAEILARMAVGQARFSAAGGCPGCRSTVLGVHRLPCSFLDEHPFD